MEDAEALWTAVERESTRVHGRFDQPWFLMVPVWNDQRFPLILAPAENVRTVTLGAQQFIARTPQVGKLSSRH